MTKRGPRKPKCDAPSFDQTDVVLGVLTFDEAVRRGSGHLYAVLEEAGVRHEVLLTLVPQLLGSMDFGVALRFLETRISLTPQDLRNLRAYYDYTSRLIRALSSSRVRHEEWSNHEAAR